MKFKIPIQIVEIEENNFHLLVESVFEDGSVKKWAIDTGASKTVFDKNLTNHYDVSGEYPQEIRSAGIGEKLIDTSVGTVNYFKLGKLTIKNQKVALIDLNHINEHYAKATDLTICGLIGGDILMKHRATINYKKRILILDPA